MSKAREIFDAGIADYRRINEGLYNTAIPSDFTIPSDVGELIDLCKQYESLLGAWISRKPSSFQLDVQDQLRKLVEPKKQDYAAKSQQLASKREADIATLNAEHTAKVEQAQKKASAGVQPLIDKHKILMSYKDKVEDVCKRYGITPTEIKVSPDITRDEYDALLTASIEGCEKMLRTKRAKFNPLALLYKPADWADSPIKQVLAITLFAIVFHKFGGIIALAFFGAMYASTIGIYKDLDKLKIAESMMYTPDFDKFMETDEIEAIPEVDTTAIETQFAEDTAKLAEADPEIELSKLMQEYNADLEYFTAEKEKADTDIVNMYNTVISTIKERLTQAKQAKEEAIAKMKKFGDGMLDETPHCYPSYKYVLGKVNEVLEQRVSFPKTSCTFSPEDPNMLSFLKLVLANALLDVKEKRQQVYIVDPEGFGKDFAEFLSQDKVTHDFIYVCTSKFDDLLKDLKDRVSANVKICGQRTLDEVNTEAEEKGMVTRDYAILVLISGCDKFGEEPANVKFMQDCYKYGLRIFYYTPTPIEGVKHFSKAFDIEGIRIPYTYSYELGEKVTSTFANAIENSKDGSIDYYTSIQEKYIPREKWGTWSTNKCIELNFGLADGDPSKGYAMKLDDANVHFLMAGQSGAGKSAAINQMLVSLICKYNPRELMLVMIDFKNVEFSTFTKPDPKSDGTLSIIPHARIMAGTKDGEYALSIFDFLIGEMERRQRVFGEVQQKKLEDYNNLMKEQGHPEKCLPRILLLIDEFQVMFTEVDKKIVDLIQDRIRSLAKLARAFGCHMWFTSQSMSGTMSNDVKANFSLRAALRCTKEVSSEIIGNGAAGDIKAKFGYLITNDSTGQDPTRNTLWRVPFLSTKNILKTMNEAAELYASQGMPGYGAPFYDEKQLHMDKELFQFYEDHKDNPKVANPHLFVLGMRTSFSLNSAPENFYIERGDFENVIIGGMEDHDLLNMARTIMDNVQAHGLKMIVSCADEDAHTLLELDERLPGNLLKWSYPTVDFANWVSDESPLMAVVNKRLAMDPSGYQPLAVILYNWDKYPGFGVAENTRALNKFKEIMRVAPTLDIHFYLIIKTKAEIPTAIFSMFKHRIVTLIDEGTSFRIIDDMKGNKLPNEGNFGIYRRGNEMHKFKVFQHEFKRTLADKELTL